MVKMKLFKHSGPMANIECNINNDIPVRIPSFPYVLLNRHVLCNCKIEAENHFFFGIIKRCQELEFKLTVYFTANLAFVKYLNNLTYLEFQILLKRTTYDLIFPISLETFDFEPELLKALKSLKKASLTKLYMNKDLQERHTTKDLEMAKKNSFLIIIQ